METHERIRRSMVRTLSQSGFYLGGWEPAALVSWLMPGIKRVLKHGSTAPRRKSRRK